MEPRTKKKQRASPTNAKRFLGLIDGQIAFSVLFVLWVLFASAFADLSVLTEGFKR